MLAAVKCAGSSKSRDRVSGPRTRGSSDTTIGRKRTALRQTASPTSNSAAPVPSAEIRITWAGPAHINVVETTTQARLNP